jgi:hypothetical protein
MKMDERCNGCIAVRICSNGVSYGQDVCLEFGLKLAVATKESVEKTNIKRYADEGIALCFDSDCDERIASRFEKIINLLA